MDSEKQGSWETSCGDEQSSKRSYECTFCKRGFTNAQALGGHMNIHRKDRAKAKQHVTVPNNSNKFHQQELLSPASARAAYHHSSGPAMFLEAYHACFRAPGPSPNPSPRILHPQYSGAESLGVNEELLGANLSLGMGPIEMESDLIMKRYMRKEDEVDLELRLGYLP